MTKEKSDRIAKLVAEIAHCEAGITYSANYDQISESAERYKKLSAQKQQELSECIYFLISKFTSRYVPSLKERSSIEDLECSKRGICFFHGNFHF
jgi:hypothetical protein